MIHPANPLGQLSRINPHCKDTDPTIPFKIKEEGFGRGAVIKDNLASDQEAGKPKIESGSI